MRSTIGLVYALAVTVGVSVLMSSSAVAQDDDSGVLSELRAALIPEEGAETPYGIPLSLGSLPQFIEWWYTVVPRVERGPRYVAALSALVAPCCDDNPAFRCCCERSGQSCNIIRSGKGLAAHLIHDLDYDAEQVQASVLEWFRFARPDYYLADALVQQGAWPLRYGLTTKGSCYRQMCDVPISEGGCGGMNELIEPAIELQEG
jgi:hypothetical protein